MTIEELIKKLKECADEDTETAHSNADGLLLAFINDQRVTDAFNAFDKWYA